MSIGASSPPSISAYREPSNTKYGYQLGEEISDGRLSSEELVRQCLDRIHRDNHDGRHLNALISVCPDALAMTQARERDEEIRAGKRRSPLHGVPIVLKDWIITSPELGLASTAGAKVISQMTPKGNSAIVNLLLDAGLVILGKANLTEIRNNATPMGFSAMGGQTLSYFRREGLSEDQQPLCGGTSSGSAVAVAAGFAPLAIGTETCGSNVYPASCSGIFGLTFSLGAVPMEGVFKISNSFDRIGVMAQSIKDLRLLANIITSPPSPHGFPSTAEDEKFNVGIVDVLWGTSQTGEAKWSSLRNEYESLCEILRPICHNVVHPLQIPSPDNLNYRGNGSHQIGLFELNETIKDFLKNFENNGIPDLRAVMEWNQQHAAIAMPEHNPGQSMLEEAVDLSVELTEPLYSDVVSYIRRLAGPEGIERTMEENDVALIVANSDSGIVSYATWIGGPVATLPMGWRDKKNGQPCGVSVVARKGDEALLLRFMEAIRSRVIL